jgi:hypothetical protein
MFTLLSVSIFYFIFNIICFLLPIQILSNILLGYTVFNFIGGYILDYAGEQFNKLYIISLTLHMILTTIIFYTFAGLDNYSSYMSLLFILWGGSLTMVNTHMIKVLQEFYENQFAFLINSITIIIYILVSIIFFYRYIFLAHMYLVFYFYLLTVSAIVLFWLYKLASQKNQYHHLTRVSFPFETIMRDTNFWITYLFLLLLKLNISFVLRYHQNGNNIIFHPVYMQIIGSILSCFCFLYLLPRIKLKYFMLCVLFLSYIMFMISYPFNNFLIGLINSFGFITFIYSYIIYPRNIGIIFSFYSVSGYVVNILYSNIFNLINLSYNPVIILYFLCFLNLNFYYFVHKKYLSTEF